jgi:hypothetical protein
MAENVAAPSARGRRAVPWWVKRRKPAQRAPQKPAQAALGLTAAKPPDQQVCAACGSDRAFWGWAEPWTPKGQSYYACREHRDEVEAMVVILHGPGPRL